MKDARRTPALAGPEQKVAALDGVRGLAILLVMVYHFVHYGGWRSDGAIDVALRRFADIGWCGVDLFFVLSGFLITGILFDSKTKGRFFQTFYMRRILRIFPLYYGFLALFFVALAFFVSREGRSGSILNEQIWYWTYLVNVRFSMNGWPDYPIIGHFWSLAVEEQFYLVWPFVVFAFGRRTLMQICLWCCAIALALRIYVATSGAASVSAFVLTPCRMDALLGGGFLALYLRGDPEQTAETLRAWLRWWPVPALAVVAMFFWRDGLNPHQDPIVYTGGLTLIAVLGIAVVAKSLLTTNETLLGRFFVDARLRFLGRYSYGLYVYHHVVIFALRRDAGYTAYGISQRFGVPELIGQLGVFVIAGAVTIAVALLSWYLWESPILRLKRLFPYVEQRTMRSTEPPSTRR